MTFICAMGANGFFGAIADTLLTTPNKNAAIHLPLHREPQQRCGPLGHIGSMVQKAEIIGEHTLVLWAGPLMPAQRVLRRIEALSDNGNTRLDLKKVCVDLDIDPHRLGLSIIYCFIEDDFIHFNSVNARGRSDPPFYYAGSGAKHFLNDLSPRITEMNGEKRNEFLNFFIPRMLSAKISEFTNGDVFQYHYGGWFEVVEVSEYIFKKRSVCLKFWEHTSSNEEGYTITKWGPLWFSLYDGNDLHVARVLAHEHSEENVDFDTQVSVVTSLIHSERSEKPDLNYIECKTDIEFHVIINREMGSLRSLMLHGHTPGDRFFWARNERSASMGISPELQIALRGGLASP